MKMKKGDDYKKRWYKKNRERILCDRKNYYQKNKEKIMGDVKKYYQNNKEKISNRNKIYYVKNREKILISMDIYNIKNKFRKKIYDMNYRKQNHVEIRNKEKEYYKNNKEKRNEYCKKRKRNDIQYNIICNFRSRLCLELRRYGNGKITSSSKYDIDWKAVINQLLPFPKERSNYHVDHIKPLCSFDLTDPQQIKQAFAPENHQWLLAKDNLKKGGRF